eukprot:jgi/Botrbrau1/23391/Bobra.0051s0038.1
MLRHIQICSCTCATMFLHKPVNSLRSTVLGTVVGRGRMCAWLRFHKIINNSFKTGTSLSPAQLSNGVPCWVQDAGLRKSRHVH